MAVFLPASPQTIEGDAKNSLNQSLMYPHLEGIPCFASLSTGRLTGGNLQTLCGEADWALDREILRLGTLNELLADLLQGLNFAGGEGDADFMDFLRDMSGSMALCL